MKRMMASKGLNDSRIVCGHAIVVISLDLSYRCMKCEAALTFDDVRANRSKVVGGGCEKLMEVEVCQ